MRSSSHTPGNLLLAALPEEELAQLGPHLEAAELHSRAQLYDIGDTPDWVYFPNRGVIGQLTKLDNGRSVLLLAIGNESMVDISVCLAPGKRTNYMTVVQVPGDALRMRASIFRELIPQNPGLERAIGRAADATLEAAARSAMCIQHHRIGQRTARWILATHDRVHGQPFRLTQDALATMVGAGRPRVSEAAGGFQKMGLISYSRGAVSVLDHDGLRQESCDCYDVIRKTFTFAASA